MNGLGVRKAAIFIDCLAPDLADRVLERLPPEYAHQVRTTWMALGRISAEERDQVIREFISTSSQGKNTGVEFSWSDRIETKSGEEETRKQVNPGANGEPFRGLREAEADKLAQILASERPPTIALVLAHLPPQQAGSVLVRLSPQNQVEIIRCLLELEETDPDILQEVDKALQEKLLQLGPIAPRRVAGLTAIKGMVQSCTQNIGEQIIHTLETVAPHIAADLVDIGPIDFNSFIYFDDTSLGIIFDQADEDVAVLALWGAPLSLVDRVFRELPAWKARQMESQLKDLGAIRLSDVEEARRRLGDLARRLALQQRIRLPRRGIQLGGKQVASVKSRNTMNTFETIVG